METTETRISDLTGNIREYIETRIDMVKLDAADTVATAASSMASWVAIAIASLFTLLLVTVGGAIGIGYLLDNYAVGFFILAGVYLLIALLVYVYRENWIRKPLINTIVKNIFDNA
jgi:hypothetical protein